MGRLCLPLSFLSKGNFIVSRRKTNIELGILDSYEVEPEAIIEEELPVEEAGTITKGKITVVGNGTISIELGGYGYSAKANTDEDWVKVGATVNVIHKGTPGRGDFEIVEMKSNG